MKLNKDKLESLCQFEKMLAAINETATQRYAQDSYLCKKEIQHTYNRMEELRIGRESLYDMVAFEDVIPVGDFENIGYAESTTLIDDRAALYKEAVQCMLEGKSIPEYDSEIITLKNIPKTGHCVVPNEVFKHELRYVQRLWVLSENYAEGDRPVHRENAFLEDQGHDYVITKRGLSYSGILRNSCSLNDEPNSGRVLIQYKITR